MDFSAWSPSHLIVAALAVATIIGQAIAVLSRLKANTEQLTEQLQKQGETFVHAMEQLEDRIDKRFGEVNQRIGETNQRIGETNQRIDGLRSEMNQGFADLRGEMNQRLSDMTGEISKLNQNHIEHLNQHQSREGQN